ncbi:MAG TPA: amidase, partial [Rudaea sp.]|nr:amidase [Rudaea sp.]
MHKKLILLGLVAATSAFAQSSITDEEFSVAQLAAKMEHGELSSHALVQRYLDRIAKIDKTGPAINAIIELNPDALSIADQLD